MLGLKHYEGRKRGKELLPSADYLKFGALHTFTNSPPPRREEELEEEEEERSRGGGGGGGGGGQRI